MVNDYFIAEDNQIYIYVDNAIYTHEKVSMNIRESSDEIISDYTLENVCEYLFHCTGRIVKDTRDLLNTYMCLFYSGDDIKSICNRRLKNMSKV